MSEELYYVDVTSAVFISHFALEYCTPGRSPAI